MTSGDACECVSYDPFELRAHASENTIVVARTIVYTYVRPKFLTEYKLR